MKNNFKFEKYIELLIDQDMDYECPELDSDKIQYLLEKKLDNKAKKEIIAHFGECPKCFEAMIFFRDCLKTQKNLSQNKNPG